MTKVVWVAGGLSGLGDSSAKFPTKIYFCFFQNQFSNQGRILSIKVIFVDSKR